MDSIVNFRSSLTLELTIPRMPTVGTGVLKMQRAKYVGTEACHTLLPRPSADSTVRTRTWDSMRLLWTDT